MVQYHTEGPGFETRMKHNSCYSVKTKQNPRNVSSYSIPWKINLENLLAKQFDHYRISRYITEFIDVFVTVWYTCFTAIAVTTEPLFFKKIPQLFRYIFRFPIPFYHHHHQFLREGKGFYFPWENRDLPPQTKKARKCAAQVRFLSKKACCHQ